MKLKVFISSVQKELADERLSLQILLTTDPFLSAHCVPILYESHLSSLKPNPKAYLDLLDNCQIYICIIWKQYGLIAFEGLSATHLEYNKAFQNKLPSLIAIKGSNNNERQKETNEFIKIIKNDGHTYERFNDIEDLQVKVRKRLIAYIKKTYHIEPNAEQDEVAKKTIRIASSFERQRLNLVDLDGIIFNVAKELVSNAESQVKSHLNNKNIIISLWQRGYLWKDDLKGYFCTAAGILLLSKDPTVIFPHTRIQAAVFSGYKKTHKLIDQKTIRKPIRNNKSRRITERLDFNKVA